LLQHQLVTLVLRPGIQVFPFKLSQSTLSLGLILVTQELFLSQSLLLCLQTLLFLKITLRLLLRKKLLTLLFFPLLLKALLLRFELLLLTLRLVGPEVVDGLRLSSHWLWWRRRLFLNLLRRPFR
jgi:hypothetical protein